MDDNLPVYIISAAADVLGVHSRTLHLYEEKGVLVPTRKGNRRFYSASDLEWIRAVRYLVHERGLNLEGMRRLLALRAMMAYKDAPREKRDHCKDFVGSTLPCWQSNPVQSECYGCVVYGAARRGLLQDEQVPYFLNKSG